MKNHLVRFEWEGGANPGSPVWVNPAHVTRVEPVPGDHLASEIHVFSWTSFAGSNLSRITVKGNVEDVALQLNGEKSTFDFMAGVTATLVARGYHGASFEYPGFINVPVETPNGDEDWAFGIEDGSWSGNDAEGERSADLKQPSYTRDWEAVTNAICHALTQIKEGKL